MKRKIFLAALFFLAPYPLDSYDREFHILSRRREIFENKDCAASKSCSLKTIVFSEETYKVGEQDEYNYGTRLIVRYKTDSPQALKDYAIVQNKSSAQQAARYQRLEIEEFELSLFFAPPLMFDI